MHPPIGEPRLYHGTVEILYPGEMAHATVDPARLAECLTTGAPLEVTDWIVEPMPGVVGWWLRTRYRITRGLGRRTGGTPRVDASLRVTDRAGSERR